MTKSIFVLSLVGALIGCAGTLQHDVKESMPTYDGFSFLFQKQQICPPAGKRVVWHRYIKINARMPDGRPDMHRIEVMDVYLVDDVPRAMVYWAEGATSETALVVIDFDGDGKVDQKFVGLPALRAVFPRPCDIANTITS